MHVTPRSVLGLALLSAHARAAVMPGDVCGINGADFLNDDFGGTNLVSGPGCTLGGSGEFSQCFCHPTQDGDPFGEWTWQCNAGTVGPPVLFGPAAGKECPASIPVPRDYDFVRPSCDTSVNPTGQAGDPSCPYHNCDQGGNNSAVCGCVDLGAFGMGDGQKWFCLHSSCSSADGYCGIEEGADEAESAGTGATLAAAAVGAGVAAALVAW